MSTEIVRHGPDCLCGPCSEMRELDRQHKWKFLKGLAVALAMVLTAAALLVYLVTS